jgi:phage protein D
VSGTGRSAPGVRIVALGDPRDVAGAPIDLYGRILSFTYEESDVRTDKLTLELDNFDGVLFDRAELLGGALLEVSWGYPGNMAPPRRVVVRKLTGYGQLSVEAHGLAALWNDKATTQRWTNATRSEVARAIAASHGYEGAFAVVDDTEERFDAIVQAAETDAWFLRRLAAKEHFLFAIDAEGFHFHARRQDDAPERVLTYYSDPALGDIRSIGVESDMTRRAGAVVVRGRDPLTKATFEAKANAGATKRVALGDVIEIIDGETGAGSSRPWNATESVRASSAASQTQAAREAEARFTQAESATLVLSLQTVGDPSLRARSIIELRGVPSRLAGKFRVHEAKHVVNGSGYATDLKIRRDAIGAAPPGQPTKPQGGAKNTAAPRAGGEQDWIELVDKESGAPASAFKAGGRPLGAGDPEGKR